MKDMIENSSNDGKQAQTLSNESGFTSNASEQQSSSNGSEPSQGSSNKNSLRTQEKPPSNELDDISKLLATPFERELEDEDDDKSDDREPERESVPMELEIKTITDLAASAGLSAKQVYDLELPQQNGEPIKLGALKDRLQEATTIKAEQAAFEERRITSENELMVARQQLERVVEQVKDKIDPKVLQEWQQDASKNLETERQRTLAVMPHLKDPAQFAAFRDEGAKFVAEWGFSAQEWGSVNDHRLLKMVADFMTTRKRVTETKAKLKSGAKAKRPPTPRQGPSDLEQLQAKAAKGDPNAELALISKLLGG